MIFLSAQPDDFYFTWQLDIQLDNFAFLNISPDKIHILIAYHPKRGVRNSLREFIRQNVHRARFFTYPDERESKVYQPAVRPHIIKKHLQQFPVLETETIFYHDSDVIFRELPDFENLGKSGTWFVSDTRSYLDSRYVKTAGSEALFTSMCHIVGISPEIVCTNDPDTGGAQYLLKCTTHSFWEKVEHDSEDLFIAMEKANHEANQRAYQETGQMAADHKEKIQSWCADMWSLLWNAWYFGKDVKLSPELDFVWAGDSIEEWNKKKILHYSGVSNRGEKKLFVKGNYVHTPPYFDSSLCYIDDEYCGKPVRDIILAKRNSIPKADGSDLAFFLPVNPGIKDNFKVLLSFTWYLYKHYSSIIYITVAGGGDDIPGSELPPNCHVVVADHGGCANSSDIMNKLILETDVPFLAICNLEVIIPVRQLTTALETLRASTSYAGVIPYSRLVKMDSRINRLFGKILDADFLEMNIGKGLVLSERAYGNTLLIRRKTFLEIGMENSSITDGTTRQKERLARCRGFHHPIAEITGTAFQLIQDQDWEAPEDRINLAKDKLEYLRVCKMTTPELHVHVDALKELY